MAQKHGASKRRRRTRYVPGQGYLLDMVELKNAFVFDNVTHVVVFRDLLGLPRRELQLFTFEVTKSEEYVEHAMLEIGHVALAPLRSYSCPTQSIVLQCTVPNFGGRRYWAICPGVDHTNPCMRRVRQLYLPPGGKAIWACTLCHNISTRDQEPVEGLTPNLRAVVHAIDKGELFAFEEVKKLAEILRLRHLGNYQEILAEPVSSDEKKFWITALTDGTESGLVKAIVAAKLLEQFKPAINRDDDFELVKQCVFGDFGET